jgi:hypothetical protein
MTTRADKIAKARKEYLAALVGNHLQQAQAKQRELVKLMTRQIKAENKEDRKAKRAA